MSTSLMKTMPAFQTEYYPKVQPRSSAERENSLLLQTALKAASSDMAHRLLDYASLDKVDCEASCILIALANHDPNRPVDSRPKKDIQQEQEESKKEQQEQQEKEEKKETAKEKPAEIVVVKENKDVTQQTHPKNDPIMLLMAAAEVVNNDDVLLNKQQQQDGGYEKRRRYSNYPSRDIRLLPSRRSIDDDERKAYPNGRYYRKTAEEQNKRVRTSPPTPAPTHQPDTWRRKSGHKSDHRSTKENMGNSNNIGTMKSNTFSRQYHSMKQNPKVKQNALHAYITYMIYNDLAHGRKQSFDSRPDDSKFVNPIMPSQDNNHQFSPFNHYGGGTQRRSTDPPVNLPQLTPNSTAPSSQTELVVDNHTTTNSSSSSSHASMSPWYNSRIHPPPAPAPPSIPPTLHDERSIISRPLTAFLWKDTSSVSSANSGSERKEMMILPPLSSRPSPSISTYDRLAPV
ncbi:hypothetical protein K501DRAFT_216652 [Backusella circina FSU 941]|nr:hypothetical protein K501DRAFT_216652 [Backusella circina FSU 941]